ncbi:RluA family pseudouridine synthase [Lacipirellula sp.]|uniref:RluA family pseudouridine synthase n=1 Tax=Lacipirellula sp. TaxID=2691419 RepID=UPI003D0B910A
MPAPQVVDQPAELLAFLFASHADVKKAKVRQWLKHGAIQVNGRSTTRFNHPLQAGDVVSIRGKEEVRAEALLPFGMKIVFEDAALIVIDKPAGLLSMANETERERTAYAHLTEYVRHGKPRSPERVWIVHRLDRETSGLMVFARSEEMKQALQGKWNEADKRYLAVVEGKPAAGEGVISSHLDESQPYLVYSVRQPNEQTRPAVTNYRVLKRGEEYALVELTLKTGRRNQIRVHLADERCPVVGDGKYGARTNPVRRLALHAGMLQFPHPVSGELLRFESPLPAELAGLV